jgi:SAM-dependent methyltransferase
MLAKARQNITEAGSRAVDLVCCDLSDAPELPTAGYRVAISTYNMLSFLDEPEAAFQELYRVLMPGGHALVMGQGLANAIASKLDRDKATTEEIHFLMREQVVRWAPHVPPLRVFSAADLTRLASAAGFRVDALHGVTSLLMPGPEDFTYPYDRMSEVSLALDDAAYFERALEAELATSGQPGWADRGVNLAAIITRL